MILTMNVTGFLCVFLVKSGSCMKFACGKWNGTLGRLACGHRFGGAGDIEHQQPTTM